MTENQLYDLNGLFHSVVKQSAVMQGRYAVLAQGSKDLDRGNLLTGIELPDTKYPLVACMPPVSQVDPSRQAWEMFSFRMLFLTTTKQDGTGAQRMRDHRTNTSQYTEPTAWGDMKAEALLFIKVLELMQATPALRNAFLLDERSAYRITRAAGAQRDDVSGVVLQFGAGIAYPCLEIENLTLPDFGESVTQYLTRINTL